MSAGVFSREFLELLAAEVAPLIRANGKAEARLLSVREAAVYLGRTEPAVRHMISRGHIKPAKIDGRVQIDRHDLDELIEMAKG